MVTTVKPSTTVQGIIAPGATVRFRPGSIGVVTFAPQAGVGSPITLTGQAVVIGPFTSPTTFTVLADVTSNVRYDYHHKDTGLIMPTKQVSNRCRVGSAVNTAAQFMSRSYHQAMDEIQGLKFAIPNWYAPNAGTGEVALASDMTVTGSIEYPAGTVTPVKWSGAASGTVSAGTTQFCDMCPIYIPKGAPFWIRVWGASATGFGQVDNAAFTGSSSAYALGDILAYGATTPDLTTVATLPTSTITIVPPAGSPYFAPVAIVGPTNSRSFAIFGDSISYGFKDDFGDGSGLVGVIERTIGFRYPFLNMSMRTETLNGFLGGTYALQRKRMARYCTDVVMEYGSNDIFSGTTLDAMRVNVESFTLQFQGQTIHVTTVTPRTTTTDNWATLVNQTLTSAPQNTVRVNHNTSLRSNPPRGVGQVWDLAAALESSLNSGLWMVPNIAADSTHPTRLGYTLAGTTMIAAGVYEV